MKTQNAFKIFGALFALVFFVSAVSAASLSVSDISFPASVSHTSGSFDVSFDLSNDGTADSAISFSVVMSSGTASTTTPSVSIADGSVTTQTINDLTVRVNFPANQNGNLIGKILVDPAGAGGTQEVDFNVAITNAPSLDITEVTPLTEGGEGLITVENEGNVDFASVALTATTDDGFSIEFRDAGTNAVVSVISLNGGESKNIKVVPVGLTDVGFGGKSIVVKAASGSTEATLDMSIEGSFCVAGEKGGKLRITNVDIENRGNGEDDEWLLLDTVEIEVEVENTDNDEDVDDVFVELGFFDSEGVNRADDLEYENSDDEEIDLGRIRDGDEETVVFRFRVPADFDDGTYRLTVKAYDDDVGEENECTATSRDLETNNMYTSISIDREDDEGKFIFFHDPQFIPSEATCGERVSLAFDVTNIGDEDQDQVRVNLRSTQLQLDESVVIRSDLDQGDSETVNFDFQVPEGLNDGLYDISVRADYDYDDGDYDESSDDDTLFQLRLLGCGTTGGDGGTGQRIAVISARLDSDAMAGEELVVRATITSTKTTSDQFTIGVEGYESWADLDDVSASVFNLASGESRDVTFTFVVDDDASGSQSFDIEVRDTAGNVETRTVEIDNIGGATGGAGAGFDFGDNTFLWIVGLVNVILVILIIVVAVRVARR